MCDPLTAVSIGGAVLSAAGSLYEGQQASEGIADLQNKQNQANADWVAYQNKIRKDQVAAEDAARAKATGAQQDTLNKVGLEAQAKTQTDEQARLTDAYTKPGAGAGQDPSNASNLLLTGESSGSKNFMDSLTTQVNQATAAARQRIGALATANSYGGSFGGLQTTTPIAFAQGGNEINMQNAIRQGNLKTYGVQQQVQPLQYGLGPGTTEQASNAKALGSVAGTLAGAAGPKLIGASGLGQGFDFGNMFGGNNWDFGAAAGDWNGVASAPANASYV